jgi:hypothetical protein
MYISKSISSYVYCVNRKLCRQVCIMLCCLYVYWHSCGTARTGGINSAPTTGGRLRVYVAICRPRCRRCDLGLPHRQCAVGWPTRAHDRDRRRRRHLRHRRLRLQQRCLPQRCPEERRRRCRPDSGYSRGCLRVLERYSGYSTGTLRAPRGYLNWGYSDDAYGIVRVLKRPSMGTEWVLKGHATALEGHYMGHYRGTIWGYFWAIRGPQGVLVCDACACVRVFVCVCVIVCSTAALCWQPRGTVVTGGIYTSARNWRTARRDFAFESSVGLPALAAGVTWALVIAKAPWAAREGHSSVIDAAGAIYVIGGWNYPTFYQDVWKSTDGGADRTRAGYSRGTRGVLGVT